MDFGILINFILNKGSTDATRSLATTLELPPCGSRIEFGNAGQAMEAQSDAFRPKTLCGTSVFDFLPDGVIVRAIIGRILDGLCHAAKRMTEAQGRVAVLNYRRYLEFALELQKYLFCKESTNEWVTIQLLNISHHQAGVEHKDCFSDGREGFNRTMCKSFHLVDGVGYLWSLKVLAGYSKRIADYISGSFSQILKIKSRLEMFVDSIDSKYMPFVKHDLSAGLSQEYFLLSTISYWLSAALTEIHRLSPSLTEACKSGGEGPSKD
jgi:hypothetical protein